MGATLGCCGGPSAGDEFTSTRVRYHPVLGGCDAVEKSLLHKIQRSLSATWRSQPDDRMAAVDLHGLSRYGLRDNLFYASDDDDDDDDDEKQPDALRYTSTSGSRLLCDFYNLVLECDHSKFFIDSHGRHVRGAYLDEILILDDYFTPTITQRRRSAPSAMATRRRRRSSVDATGPYKPRGHNWSVMSTGTSATMTSDADYWAYMDSFMQDEDDGLLGGASEGGSTSYRRRTRQDSAGSDTHQHHRRPSLTTIWSDPYYPSSLGHDSMGLLFSPVNTTASSTGSTFSPPFVPVEGIKRELHHSNLWRDDPISTKKLHSSTTTTTTTATMAATRRNSLVMAPHAVLPIMAS